MIRLYQGSGSTEIQLLTKASDEDWLKLKNLTIRLLRARNLSEEAELLRKYPFHLCDGTNWFGDEFSLLFFEADVNLYVEMAELEDNPIERRKFTNIAKTITEIGPFIRFIAVGLKAGEESILPQPDLKVTDETIEEAVRDAEALIGIRGPVSAVDRMHTGLHGYLKRLCQESGIEMEDSWPVTRVFKELRANHPAFSEDDDVQKRICNSLAAIVDAVNFVRNRQTQSHPNRELIDEPGAILVINSVRTIIHYLNDKL